MFKLLGCLIFLCFFALVIIVAPLLSLVLRLLGFGRTTRRSSGTFGDATDAPSHPSASGNGHASSGNSKIYAGNEGEYVDFEDVPTANTEN